VRRHGARARSLIVQIGVTGLQHQMDASISAQHQQSSEPSPAHLAPSTLPSAHHDASLDLSAYASILSHAMSPDELWHLFSSHRRHHQVLLSGSATNSFEVCCDMWLKAVHADAPALMECLVGQHSPPHGLLALLSVGYLWPVASRLAIDLSHPDAAVLPLLQTCSRFVQEVMGLLRMSEVQNHRLSVYTLLLPAELIACASAHPLTQDVTIELPADSITVIIGRFQASLRQAMNSHGQPNHEDAIAARICHWLDQWSPLMCLDHATRVLERLLPILECELDKLWLALRLLARISMERDEDQLVRPLAQVGSSGNCHSVYVAFHSVSALKERLVAWEVLASQHGNGVSVSTPWSRMYTVIDAIQFDLVEHARVYHTHNCVDVLLSGLDTEIDWSKQRDRPFDATLPSSPLLSAEMYLYGLHSDLQRHLPRPIAVTVASHVLLNVAVSLWARWSTWSPSRARHACFRMDVWYAVSFIYQLRNHMSVSLPRTHAVDDRGNSTARIMHHVDGMCCLLCKLLFFFHHPSCARLIYVLLPRPHSLSV
jgi:hypothetical protein